jgi:RimJ/RimL family protein N-acetyltransferase
MSSQPEQFESSEKLPDGTVIRLRSIRPDDERLLQDLAAHMSPEDMRLRFLVAMRGLSHELAVRLSHIDHDRDVALLAFAEGAEGAEEVLGVARFSSDHDTRAAEFAIAVRTDWKGHGLGHLLMARLMQLARQCGINELVGVVLPENAAMLQLCREFGFTIGISPDDPKLRLVSQVLKDPDALTCANDCGQAGPRAAYPASRISRHRLPDSARLHHNNLLRFTAVNGAWDAAPIKLCGGIAVTLNCRSATGDADNWLRRSGDNCETNGP